MKSEKLAEVWMNLLAEFNGCFTRPGRERFRALLCGSLACERRPLVTEIVSALGIENHWRALEAFVEYGAWPTEDVEKALCALAARAGRWQGRQIWSVDDLKVLKSGRNIWGTCSFHEYTSRSPNRAETVWAHNWVLGGALEVGLRRAFLPAAARLYMRKTQLPGGERFRKKTELAVEVLRGCARSAQGPHLAIFDGGYAVCSMVEPLTHPGDTQVRVEFLTRLRFDSRLYQPVLPRAPGQMGRPRKWGRRLPAPREGCNWPGPWQQSKALVYGKLQGVRYKQVQCRWHPAGPDVPVRAIIAQIQGQKRPWYLVSSDLSLSAEQAVELYSARFAQEDAHRDLKQHLGLGACQGRLKHTVLCMFQLRLLAATLLRLLSQHLDSQQGDAWWPKPPWYPQKEHGSLRDVKALLIQITGHFSQLPQQGQSFQNSYKANRNVQFAMEPAA